MPLARLMLFQHLMLFWRIQHPIIRLKYFKHLAHGHLARCSLGMQLVQLMLILTVNNFIFRGGTPPMSPALMEHWKEVALCFSAEVGQIAKVQLLLTLLGLS